MYICNFVIIPKCKKVWPLHLNKLKSSLPRDAFCQVWLKLTQWFWRRRFFNFVNVFSPFRNYLPFEMGVALYLNKIDSPSPKDALCQVCLKLAQWFWRRRWKCEKFTDRRTNGQMDWRATGYQKISLELSTLMSLKILEDKWI